MNKVFGSIVLFLVFGAVAALGTHLFQFWDSMPQVAWSHKEKKCVSVEVKGTQLQDGCQKVATGEINIYDRYFVE